MIDAHCHISFPDFDNTRDDIIKDSMAEMTAIVDSAPSIEDSAKSLKLAKDYPNFVFSCIGLHPEDITKLTEKQIENHMEFIKLNAAKIVAVGEVGIDNFHVRDEPNRKKCREVFIQFIDLAKEIQKPLVIHSREDNGEAVKILEGNSAERVILHCFGSPDAVGAVTENGWFASLPTLIVRSNKHKRLAKEISLEYILTETDSPFLSPTKDKTNVPKNVRVVVDIIASELGLEPSEIDKITTKNAIKAFNLPVDQ